MYSYEVNICYSCFGFATSETAITNIYFSIRFYRLTDSPFKFLKMERFNVVAIENVKIIDFNISEKM